MGAAGLLVCLLVVAIPASAYGGRAGPAEGGEQHGLLPPLLPGLPELPGILPEVPGVGVPPVGGDEKKRRPGVRARSTPPRQRAQVKTLPIGRSAGARPVSVSSLPLRPLGQLRPGVGLEVAGELQVTVCLRPDSGPRRRRGDCRGRVYDYDPRIRVRLALAPSARSSGRRAFTIGRARTLRCRQQQPNRNHHCTIALPWRRISLGGRRGMPSCAPEDCRLNLIAAAHHRRSGPRHRVVVGGIDKRGRTDNRGESRISAIRYRRGARVAEPLRARVPAVGSLPLAPAGQKIRLRSVYSLPLEGLRAGQRLKLDAVFAGAIGHLPYNARTRTRLILADRPGATVPGPRARRATRGSAYATAVSNFNCTRGPSGHRTPCPIRKSGVLRIGSDSERPLYANLVAGYGAIGSRSNRHRRRHRVHLGRRGFLKVWRYGPAAGSNG